jgi:signal transduction histidine kinase
MNARADRRTMLFSWAFVCVLLAVCATLGILQYRWINRVNDTARDRMREDLRDKLARLSQDFNAEISTASSSIARTLIRGDAASLDARLLAGYAQWKSTSRRPAIFDRIGLAVPGTKGLSLQLLDPQRNVLSPAAWPTDWTSLHDRLERRLAVHRDDRQPGPPPDPGGPHRASMNDGLAFEIPVFDDEGIDARPGPHFPPHEHEIAWVVFNSNLPYMRETMLPELLRRTLGSKSGLDYQVEVVERGNPASLIFESDPQAAASVIESADASVDLFQPQAIIGQRRGPGGFDEGHGGNLRGGPPVSRGHISGGGPGRGPADLARWTMYVRHRAGSLEAVVEQTRLRNLAVTGGVLLLMLATALAFLRYTLRAQRLAAMQMDFVAGVSHELRTPLTVIHTAGYNLRGKIARHPAQVEQYGAMIQRESERLRQLVEQVLRFSSANAGRVVQEMEPLSVARIIEETVEANRPAIDGSTCVLESNVDAELPPVLGDPRALRHALENLLGNAVKYGARDGHWVGIFASKADGDSRAVEIRVADHGPGIPEEEQPRIFDPFFRGARAVQDQIHGTGLGLSLVKKIVEAHGGSIRVESAPLRGAEFIVRIPIAPEAA